MSTFLLVIGALLMSAAIVAAFRNLTASCVCAYAGIWAMRASGHAPVPSGVLMFWAIAVLLVISITMTRGHAPVMPARAGYFIAGGALAGMAAGLMFYQAGAIIGAAAGAILGGIAFSGLSRQRDFRTVGRWIVSAGLPATVTMSLIALGIQGLLARTSL